MPRGERSRIVSNKSFLCDNVGYNYSTHVNMMHRVLVRRGVTATVTVTVTIRVCMPGSGCEFTVTRLRPMTRVQCPTPHDCTHD